MECKNVGTTDQIFRLVLAIVLLVIGLFYAYEYQNILAIISGLIVLTALLQFCPLYRVLGVNTCETKRIKTVEEAKMKTIEGQMTKSKKMSAEYKKESKTPKVSKSKKTPTKAKKVSKKNSTKKKTKRGATKTRKRKKKR